MYWIILQRVRFRQCESLNICHDRGAFYLRDQVLAILFVLGCDACGPFVTIRTLQLKGNNPLKKASS